MAVSYFCEGVADPLLDARVLTLWVKEVALRHGKQLGTVTYKFVDDAGILACNQQFLGHDYYTDVITFDYSTPRRIQGDIVISLDTVASNATLFGESYARELYRVIIHGVLHLCGIPDKGEGEREIMERHEEEALALLPEFLPTAVTLETKQ